MVGWPMSARREKRSRALFLGFLGSLLGLTAGFALARLLGLEDFPAFVLMFVGLFLGEAVLIVVASLRMRRSSGQQ